MSERGKCPECGYSVRLRKDGTVQRHSLYVGRERVIICPQYPWPVYPVDQQARERESAE